MNDEGFLAGLSALFLIAMVGISCWLLSASCYSQWERSGFAVSWGLMKGCTIQLKDGTWIPADAYREIK